MQRILFDTNIIIHREDTKVVPDEVQKLLKTLSETNNKILVHPLSSYEINKDKDSGRRKIVLSKLNSYPVVESPPEPKKDADFLSFVGKPKNTHDLVDNNLLYCVYKDAIDFLITEDEKIHKKATRIGVSDRVFRVSDALYYFNRFLVEKISHPPPLTLTPVYNLDINDPIFDSLKKDYGFNDFTDWWEKICRKGRKAWVYPKDDGKIGAILILKEENEPIPSIPPLPKKRRLKICTIKAVYTGYKIGELFIKISIQKAIQKNIDEIYLTHFTKPNSFLVTLIEDYGFCKIAKKENGEDVFVKRLFPERDKKYAPQDIYKKFYPSFYDGEDVSKFIVPIRPPYHNKLFTEHKNRQPTLREFTGEFIVEGNTIKKAYLCHSQKKYEGRRYIIVL